jgi:hypothetical protein
MGGEGRAPAAWRESVVPRDDVDEILDRYDAAIARAGAGERARQAAADRFRMRAAAVIRPALDALRARLVARGHTAFVNEAHAPIPGALGAMGPAIDIAITPAIAPGVTVPWLVHTIAFIGPPDAPGAAGGDPDHIAVVVDGVVGGRLPLQAIEREQVDDAIVAALRTIFQPP